MKNHTTIVAAALKQSLLLIRESMEKLSGKQIPLMTINAWSEWTGGSDIEPGTCHGTGYLEAI